MYTKRPPIVSTIFDLLRLKRKALQIIKSKNINVVHCRTILTAIVGLHFKRKLNLKMIFDMRSFLADERVDGKLWNLNNPIYKKIYSFFKQKERACLIEADQIVSLTNAAKKEMLTWNLGIQESKITVIPCCVDVQLFDPSKLKINNRTIVRNELGINENDFVFIYVGGIGTWYCLDEMMEFFSTSKQTIPTAKFLIVTAEKPALVYQSSNKFNINKADIIILESLRNDVPKYLNAADCALFFILPAYSKIASSPTKQGEMMAMQLPIVCNDNVGDTGDIIRKYDAGWVVQKFNISEYEKIIAELSSSIQLDKHKIRFGAEEYFGLHKGIEKYYNLYKGMV
jgi:glycosyltransferase involved in cell wall biosynthesis